MYNFFAFSMLYLFFVSPAESIKPLNGVKALFVIAHNNFRDEEYQIPRNILESAGVSIITASSDTTLAKGMIDLTVKPDLLLSKVNPKNFDAIIFVGGSGSTEYWEDKTAHAILDTAYKENKIISAICLAPVTLAKAKILKGRKATVYETPATLRIFKEEKVNYTGEPVTVSGNIVTANGPQSAKRFAEEILQLMLKKKRAEK